jgi:hypothetical protein
LYEAVTEVPTCAKLEQLEPAQRWITYPVTPTLSVDAVQLRDSWVIVAPLAVRPVGAVGAVVSAVVEAVAVLE